MPDERLLLNPPQVIAQSRLDCQPLPVSIETTSASLGADLEGADRSFSINCQYATLMSPNPGETAVCGSSILCWMTGEVIIGCYK